jgi:CHAT domain-containing protein
LAIYHGHARLDASHPLQSALVLNPDDDAEYSNRYLTARQILNTRLQVALFVMITCESAKQELRAGEEPSGGLPMLMLAGVTSAIGTLWKCSDIVGKEFIEELFADLPALLSTRGASSVSGGVLFDVAKPCRKRP